MGAHKVTLKCNKCGGSNFTIPNDAPPSARIVCNDCGQDFSSLGELKMEIERQAAEQRRRALDSVKGLKPN